MSVPASFIRFMTPGISFLTSTSDNRPILPSTLAALHCGTIFIPLYLPLLPNPICSKGYLNEVFRFFLVKVF